MSTTDRVRALCEPVLAELDAELFDLDFAGGVLRITLERESGVDLELIADATRRISRLLDEHDPIAGRYTLEVSSPGLERALRTPAHWRWAIGNDVSIKLRPGVAGERRLRGVVRAADERATEIELVDPAGERRTVAYDDIERARTIFEWGPAPKPGGKVGASRPTARETTSDAEVEIP